MKKKGIFLITMLIALIIPNIALAFVSGLRPTPSAPATISGFVSKILGLIQFVGYGIAIGMIIYIGIKFMMSAADDKANAKQALMNWIIGVIIIVGASTFFGILANFFANADGGGGGNAGNPNKNTPIKGETTMLYIKPHGDGGNGEA